MIRRPPRSTRTDTLFPYTTLFRSGGAFKTLRAGGSVPYKRDAFDLHRPQAAAVQKRRRPPRRGAGEARGAAAATVQGTGGRSEEHTSELQSLMRISYAVFCLKKQRLRIIPTHHQSIFKQHNC